MSQFKPWKNDGPPFIQFDVHCWAFTLSMSITLGIAIGAVTMAMVIG